MFETKEFLTKAYRAGGACGVVFVLTAAGFWYLGEVGMMSLFSVAALFTVLCSQALYWYAKDILPRWFSRVPKEEEKDD